MCIRDSPDTAPPDFLLTKIPGNNMAARVVDFGTVKILSKDRISPETESVRISISFRISISVTK